MKYMLVLIPLLFIACKKKPVDKPSSYVITMTVTGTGVYHYQKGGIGGTSHANGFRSFVLGAEKNDLIELDAQSDTATKSISIEISISPGSDSHKSGLGKQQLQYQL